MADFLGLRKDALHHAYLIEGEREAVLPELLAFVENDLEMPARGNPDVLVLEYETFGIDEGRYLQGLEGLKPAVGARKIFIVAFHFITREAQNAFLKLFEEPFPGTHFFLITRSASVLLPTLRSRLQVIRRPPPLWTPGVHNGHPVSIMRKSGGRQRRAAGASLAEKFLKTAPGKRIDLFKGMLEEKDKVAALAFLSDLEVALYNSATHSVSGNTRAFEEIQRVRGYVYDSGAMLKMLLEHLALTVPAK